MPRISRRYLIHDGHAPALRLGALDRRKQQFLADLLQVDVDARHDIGTIDRLHTRHLPIRDGDVVHAAFEDDGSVLALEHFVILEFESGNALAIDIDHADDLGFTTMFWQEGGAVDESFTPAFDTTGVLTSAK